jgi:hypothetical protein
MESTTVGWRIDVAYEVQLMASYIVPLGKAILKALLGIFCTSRKHIKFAGTGSQATIWNSLTSKNSIERYYPGRTHS